MTMHALIAGLPDAFSVFRRLWRWWLWELLEIVPKAWRDRMHSRIEAHVMGDNIELKIVRPNSSKQGVLHGPVDTVEPEAFRRALQRERTKLPVWLFPPPDSILSRIVQVPRSVLPTFDKLLSLEADRWTPFKLPDIAIAWRQVASHGDVKVDMELLFISHACVEPWKRRLTAFELPPCSIVLAPEQDLHARTTTESRARAKAGSLGRAAAVIFILIAGISVPTDWVATIRQRDAWRQRVDFEQREYSRQRDIEKKIATLIAVSVEQSRAAISRSRGMLLASLTAAIPDTDWLTEIAIRSEAITLRGYAAKPETLLKALESLGSNREVTLQGELAFDAKLERQRFSIAFRMREKAND